MRGHSSAFNNQGTTIPYCGNSDEVDANLREQDKKVEQKLARQRIIARQRKRMRPISTFVRTFRQEAPRPEAEERPCSKNKKVSSPLRNVPSHVDSRASQRRRIDFETLTTDTMEWYNRLIDTADFNVGPSFLEELSGKDFGISEGCDDIESCHSSTGSRATALIDLE